MPLYSYRALDSSRNEVSGELEAKHRDNVAAFLHEKGYTVLSVDEKVKYFEEIFSSGTPKVSLKNKVVLSKQLATMLGAGLPMVQALEIIIQQTNDKALKKNLQGVLDDIQKSGMPLSDAFLKNTKLYNDVQINLIRAGETSGNLYEVLVKVADDLEKSKKLKAKIRGAMIYPAIIFVVVGIVMAVMMVYMIPAVKDLYSDFGIGEEGLPGVTRMLVAMSDFMTDPFGATIIITVIVGSVVGTKYYYSTPGGRLVIDKLALKIPVVKDLVSKVHIAEFARLLSMLIKSGVPIIKSIEIVSSALSNVHFKNALLNSIDDVSNGIPLAVPLSRSEVYPPLIVKMVAIGEETGKMDSVLADMAKFYDDEVDELSDNLNKLMEPLILIIVGSIVAFLAIGIYLPIYSIGNNI